MGRVVDFWLDLRGHPCRKLDDITTGWRNPRNPQSGFMRSYNWLGERDVVITHRKRQASGGVGQVEYRGEAAAEEESADLRDYWWLRASQVRVPLSGRQPKYGPTGGV